jgi:hypothetical protein
MIEMRTRRLGAEKQQELKVNEDAKKDVMARNNAQAIDAQGIGHGLCLSKNML